MAQILPINSDLGDVQEGASIDITFKAQLTANETLKSINIIKYEETDGIIVEGPRLYGSYNSVFTFGSDALKYRQGDEFKTASSWEDLPSTKDTDLYLWKAPQSLTRTFTYEVEMIYTFQEQSNEKSAGDTPEPPPPPIEKTLTKTYTQLVFGNWSRWSDKLRQYVYERD